jgi:hypothetical protein
MVKVSHVLPESACVINSIIQLLIQSIRCRGNNLPLSVLWASFSRMGDYSHLTPHLPLDTL